MQDYKDKEYIKNLMNSQRIVELRKRAKRCRCKYCGGKLRLKQIVYNSVIEPRIEIFCDTCQRIEYGVEPEIYNLAKYYVDEFGCDYYPELDDNIVKERMNVAKVCEIMFWVMNGVGYMDVEGFKFPVKIDKKLIGESIVYNLDQLDEDPIDEERGEL